MTDITNPEDPKNLKKPTNSEDSTGSAPGSDSEVKMLPETLVEVVSVGDTSIAVRASHSTEELTVEVTDPSKFKPGGLVLFGGLELSGGGLELGGITGELLSGTSTGIAPVEGVGFAARQPVNITEDSRIVRDVTSATVSDFGGRIVVDLYRHLVKVSKIDEENGKITVILFKDPNNSSSSNLPSTMEFSLPEHWELKDFNEGDLLKVDGRLDDGSFKFYEKNGSLIQDENDFFVHEWSKHGTRPVDAGQSAATLISDHALDFDSLASQLEDDLSDEGYEKIEGFFKVLTVDVGKAIDVNKIKELSDLLMSIEVEIESMPELKDRKAEITHLINDYLEHQTKSIIFNKNEGDKIDNVHPGLTNSGFRIPIFPATPETAFHLFDRDDGSEDSIYLDPISESLLSQLTARKEKDSSFDANSVFKHFSRNYRQLRLLENGGSIPKLQDIQNYLDDNNLDSDDLIALIAPQIKNKTLNLRSRKDAEYALNLFGDEMSELKVNPENMDAAYALPLVMDQFEEIDQTFYMYNEFFNQESKQVSVSLQAKVGHLPIQQSSELYKDLFPNCQMDELEDGARLPAPTMAQMAVVYNSFAQSIEELNISPSVKEILISQVEEGIDDVREGIELVTSSEHYKKYERSRLEEGNEADEYNESDKDGSLTDDQNSFIKAIYEEQQPNSSKTAHLKPIVFENSTKGGVYVLDEIFKDADGDFGLDGTETLLTAMEKIREHYKANDEAETVEVFISEIDSYLKRVPEELKNAPLSKNKDGFFMSPPTREHLELYLFHEDEFENATLPILSISEHRAHIDDLSSRLSDSREGEFYLDKIKNKSKGKYYKILKSYCEDDEQSLLDVLSEGDDKEILRVAGDVSNLASMLQKIKDATLRNVRSGNKEINPETPKHIERDLVKVIERNLINFTLVDNFSESHSDEKNLSVIDLNNLPDDLKGVNRKEAFVKKYVSNPSDPIFKEKRDRLLELLGNNTFSISGLNQNSPLYSAIMTQIRSSVETFPNDKIRQESSMDSDDYRFAMLDYTDENEAALLNKISEYSAKDILGFYCGDQPKIKHEKDELEKRAHRLLRRDSFGFGSLPKKVNIDSNKLRSNLGSYRSKNKNLDCLIEVINSPYEDWDHEKVLQIAQNKESVLSNDVVQGFVDNLGLSDGEKESATRRINYLRRTLNNVNNNILTHSQRSESKQITISRNDDLKRSRVEVGDKKEELEKRQAQYLKDFNKRRDTFDFEKKISTIDPSGAKASDELSKSLTEAYKFMNVQDMTSITKWSHTKHPLLGSFTGGAENLLGNSTKSVMMSGTVVFGFAPPSILRTALKKGVANKYRSVVGELPYAPFAPDFIKKIQEEAESKKAESIKGALGATLSKYSDHLEYKRLELEMISEDSLVPIVTKANQTGAIESAKLMSPSVRDSDVYLDVLAGRNRLNDFLSKSSLPYFKKFGKLDDARSKGDDVFDILKPGAPPVIISLVRKHLKEEESRSLNIKKSIVLSDLKELKMLNREKTVSPQRTIRAMKMLLQDNLFKSSELLSIVTEFFNEALEDEDVNGRVVVNKKIEGLVNGSKGLDIEESLDATVDKERKALVSFDSNSNKGFVTVTSSSSSQLIFNPPTYKDPKGVEQRFDVKDLTITQIMKLLNTTAGNPEFKDEEYVTNPTVLFKALSSSSKTGNFINLEDRSEESLFDEMIEVQKNSNADLSVYFVEILKMVNLKTKAFEAYKKNPKKPKKTQDEHVAKKTNNKHKSKKTVINSSTSNDR